MQDAHFLGKFTENVSWLPIFFYQGEHQSNLVCGVTGVDKLVHILIDCICICTFAINVSPQVIISLDSLIFCEWFYMSHYKIM